MSFNPYDMIHTGNYESFFLLYIDQELNDAQMKMVDEFLLSHPELQSEFDLLMSTRLPVEHFSFDKESLMAENMHPGSVAEDLLLYIDDELPADKKNIIEFELASNKDYQQQFESLKLARLDASEIIEYPNKKELYRHTERVIAFRPWMRVAAAAVVIAISGVIYLQKPGQSEVKPATTAATKNVQPKPVKTTPSEKNDEVPVNESSSGMIAAKASENRTKKDVKKKEVVKPQDNQDFIVSNQTPGVTPDRTNTENSKALVSNIVAGQAEAITKSVAATFNPVLNKETINKPGVTSNSAERTTNDVANNDKKGSVKGFLRKATRLIEKRTGIDPTNDNGELLIGVVAVNLK